MKKELP
jgi:hypothetical protein